MQLTINRLLPRTIFNTSCNNIYLRDTVERSFLFVFLRYYLKSFAELGGSTAFGLPEETVKMAECVETTGETNFGNRVLCRQ